LGILLSVLLFSCGQQQDKSDVKIITVSIAPFKYFVEEIGGDDFSVNVMVPPGADPHIYEPYPDQIAKLRLSSGYISNGYLGFEMIWLNNFYEANRQMKKLSLKDKIDPLVNEHHHHEREHVEGADPHFWVSLSCGSIIASSVKDFLIELNPEGSQEYEENYNILISKIEDLDIRAKELFSDIQSRSFMIFHPNLGYMARDYDLEEVSVEHDGKEPSPSQVRELIDRARNDGMKTVFVQREYDTKHAKMIAGEIGAEIRIIDPLSEDWLQTTSEIIHAVHNSLSGSNN
jgi:zinc transport system substrate-binding protein